MPVHYTHQKFIDNFIILVNTVNSFLTSTTSPTSHDALLDATSDTIASYKTQLDAITGISEVNQRPYIAELKRVVDQLKDYRITITQPAASGALTDAGAGGTLLEDTTYYYVITAVDPDGVESTPSVQFSQATANDNNNTHKMQFPAYGGVRGAASYRVYRSTTTGVFTAGYVAATKSALEGGTFEDTGAALTVASPPDVNLATTRVLIDADIAAAKADTAETTTLLNRVKDLGVDSRSTSQRSGVQFI